MAVRALLGDQRGGGFRPLEENQRVEYEVTQDQKGPQASNIRPI
ncbi:MAG TPA: cold shock domain-containing protein [Candidatus Limnocylindrales bacterium]|nr:cold shock domain-containing protein [Candidatus Limnocylindrales bacterium]